MNSPAPWLDEARRLPVAFAQVREDALLDLEVLDLIGDRVYILMVASGGCTAAALAAAPQTAHIHLVDPNPAQLALTRVKLHLLQTAPPDHRLALLGHAPMDAHHRHLQLTAELKVLGLPPDVLGPPDVVAQLGPDHAGRYEWLFARLRDALQTHEAELAHLVELTDPAKQAECVHPETALGRALDEAFDSTMALPNLVQLFGEGATRNRVEPFAVHFARRTRHVLATQPARTNPYLWQLLRGRFPPHSVYPWLTAAPPTRMPEVTWSAAPMADVLATASDSFDFVHLSNILDWLSPEEAAQTLTLAWQALRPGGFVFIRQLNSLLDIPALTARFVWLSEAPSMHARDRSFFYRALHLGRKP